MLKELTHPTPEELSAFGLGQLPPQETAVIEAHITECPPCCETLLGFSEEDTFVALLKEADRNPHEATVELNLNASSDSREAAAEIPPSLLEHARYHVVGLVGRGGMGDVYKAEHRMMERTVALKVINRDLISKPEAVQRFHREVRAAARLTHPNIVTA
jgi:anti-sigma factor RsiW